MSKNRLLEFCSKCSSAIACKCNGESRMSIDWKKPIQRADAACKAKSVEYVCHIKLYIDRVCGVQKRALVINTYGDGTQSVSYVDDWGYCDGMNIVRNTPTPKIKIPYIVCQPNKWDEPFITSDRTSVKYWKAEALEGKAVILSEGELEVEDKR